MKIQRKWLLVATASIGVFMILYTLARQFLGLDLGDGTDKLFFDGVFIAAIGLLMLNRKIAADEKKEAESRARKDAEAESAGAIDQADGAVSGSGASGSGASGRIQDETDAEGR